MADKKISQLIAAATPLAGTEVLPIVQSGSTVKVAVADLTAGRTVTATSISAGLGAVGTPSYTFTGDTNTGMWSPAADTIAFSEGGVEAMRIDSTARVGIGTTTPSVNGRLSVAGTVVLGPLARNEVATQRVGVWTTGDPADDGRASIGFTTVAGGASSSSFITFDTNNYGVSGGERMRIDSSGNVGIGTSSPSFQLQLSTDSAAKPTTALWTIASDSRLKNETGDYTKGLDAVCALRPITYTYNGAAGFAADGGENISIIAQEAMEHFPECVGTYSAKMHEDDEEETELYNWNGHALMFALVNAVKELKTQNDDLRARVAQLEGN